MARIRKVSRNNDKATWENTAKEQPYLMPGTAEYEERVEDLQSHSPQQPDDEFHVVLEERNEAVPEVLQGMHPKTDQVGTERRLRERVKEGMYESVSERLQREASLTPTTVDDELAASLRPKDLSDYTSDPTVMPDEYEDSVLEDLL